MRIIYLYIIYKRVKKSIIYIIKLNERKNKGIKIKSDLHMEVFPLRDISF